MKIVNVLLLVFVVLKLNNLIDWSWVWVLSPLWISAILIIALVILSLILDYFDKKKLNKDPSYRLKRYLDILSNRL